MDRTEDRVRLQDRTVPAVDLRHPPGMIGIVENEVARARRLDLDENLGVAVADDSHTRRRAIVRCCNRIAWRRLGEEYGRQWIERGPPSVLEKRRKVDRERLLDE